MAVIYLRHPKHGAKVACSDMEAAHDEQHGWRQYDPNEPDEPVSEAAETPAEPTPASEPVNSLAEPRKRGRPRKE